MAEQRYLVSARKYRPLQFKDLVAQGHVAQTLRNALRLKRLAHAYLFSGPRGVGKTTAARILAKAINCESAQEEPCRNCGSCEDFESGRSLSIFEIDAASNNKVEDVRELQETVRIPPQGGRKKVYIIDEVHMLSVAAFNALLKTLEEPPPHVLFIFATTQPHKVLPTILSRCQRFDFRRIPVQEIVAHLKSISANEGITADEDSLMLIARKGDGALRDALSAFDQAVAMCGEDLKYAELAAALGVVDVEHHFAVTRHAAASDSGGMLLLVDQLMSRGHDIQEFLGGLAEHLRNLLVACSLRDASLIDASDAVRHRYLKHAAKFNEATLLRLLMVVEEAQRSITTTSHARLRLELALLKLARMQDAVVLTEALEQLDGIIAKGGAGTLAASPRPSARPTQPPKDKGHARRGSPEARSRPPRGTRNTAQDNPPPPQPRSEPKPAEAAASDAPLPAQPPASLELFQEHWNQAIAIIHDKVPYKGTMLDKARLLDFENGVLRIGVSDETAQDSLSRNGDFLMTVLRECCGVSPNRIVYEVDAELQADSKSSQIFDPSARLRERAEKEPIVRALIQKLGADIAW